MTIETFYRIPMVKLVVFWISLTFHLTVFGQGVPVEQTEQPITGSNQFLESELGMDFLTSDPDELLSIDGLDEPMERLRLRDSDTNSILDMIQF